MLREKHGLTLKDLSARSLIHYSQLSRFEHGLEPNPQQLERIAAAFGMGRDNLARTLGGR